MCFVEESAAAGARGEELIGKRGVDDSDEWFSVVDKGDADAEHGEEVDVVYGSVEGVDTPCWGGVDEVVA